MPFNAEQDAFIALCEVIAERTSPLLVWTGAGLSIAAGLPTWAELRQTLMHEAADVASTAQTKEEIARLAAQVDSIGSESNFWVAFQRLRAFLGPATYQSIIRRNLTPGDDPSCIPADYLKIWQLPAAGVLTLNIDGLVSRAFNRASQGRPLNEFSGRDVGNLTQLLHVGKPFVAHLHGIVENSSSWVFTYDSLSALMASKSYETFITTCLATFTNVFLGVSADDIAISAHLDRLRSIDVTGPTHFWFTNRYEGDLRTWAESVGIRRILYQASTRDEHRAAHDEFFEGLLNATPAETRIYPPVRPNPSNVTEPSVGHGDLDPKDLRGFDPEALREVLNIKAAEILARGDSSWSDYEQFVRKFDPLIYQAWYVSTGDGVNNLLGYVLEEEVAEGAFGRVFRARNSQGEEVAIKVLHESIRRDSALLQSFRRGVRAMGILTDRAVQGLVRYHEGSEIPAFVVMDWVDGPTLSQAKEGHYLEDWPTVLRVADEVSEIISRAHALPERVLHRDLRPANIMLEGFYSGDWKTVVLDFDLAWHAGSNDKSVAYSTAMGYLAPEQVAELSGSSTRSASVDAFGFGTTLNFLCGGEEPVLNEQFRADYEDRVRESVSSLEPPRWKSIPARFSRLILGATRERQSERWDFSQIRGEIARLRAAEAEPERVGSAELLAEEFVTRVDSFAGYEWDAARSQALRMSPTGLSLRVSGDEVLQQVELIVRWVQTGVEQRVGLRKYIERNADVVADQLSSVGWTVRYQKNPGDFEIRATVSTKKMRDHLDAYAIGTEEAIQRVRFG